MAYVSFEEVTRVTNRRLTSEMRKRHPQMKGGAWVEHI